MTLYTVRAKNNSTYKKVTYIACISYITNECPRKERLAFSLK